MELNKNYIYIDQKADTPIFRFTTVDRILSLICKSQYQNTLASPRKWNDPFENILRRMIFKDRNGNSFKHPLRDRSYGQCWTLTEETDAAWRMYAPEGNGVRLKTTIKKLYKSLEQSLHELCFPGGMKQGIIDPLAGTACFIGQVQYKTEAELSSCFSDPKWVEKHLWNGSNREQAESLLLKREAFKPEQEIRLIYLDPQNNGDDFYHYTVEKDFIEQIIFDPRMEDDIYEAYSSILRKYSYFGDIGKSTLYWIPHFEIIF